MRVVAVVNSYRPSREQLGPVIDAVAPQVDHLVVVDDGSGADYAELLAGAAERARNVELLVRDKNEGIAAATNAGLERARQLGATHVIHFDQDSVPTATYVRDVLRDLAASSAAGLSVGSVSAGRINGVPIRDTITKAGFPTVREAIQSGMLVPMRTFERVGFFREGFVIDCVDIDLTIRIEEAGMVNVVSQAGMNHPIGRRLRPSIMGRPLRLGTRPVEFSYHPAFRRYYITRNRLILFKEHALRNPRWVLRHALRECRVALLGIVFGGAPMQQCRAIGAGVLDGLRGVEGVGRRSDFEKDR